MTLFARWVTIKCQKCGKVHCEATPGAKVRFKCKNTRCRTWQIAET